MTEIELIEKILEVGQHFCMMDHFCRVSIQKYPHIEDKNFEEGEIAYEVSCSELTKCNSNAFKNLKDALLDTLENIKIQVAGQISDLESNERSLQHWKKIYEML